LNGFSRQVAHRKPHVAVRAGPKVPTHHDTEHPVRTDPVVERLQHRDGVAGRVGQDGDADLLARARDLPLQPADVGPRGVSVAGAANTA
jgi:hypothetical protein